MPIPIPGALGLTPLGGFAPGGAPPANKAKDDNPATDGPTPDEATQADQDLATQ